MTRQTGRRLILLVLAQILALGALAAWAGRWDGIAAPALAAAAPAQARPCTDTALSYRQPFDVPVSASNRQTDFDCFSWRSLVALNWPASSQAAGQPDTTRCSTGSPRADSASPATSTWSSGRRSSCRSSSSCPPETTRAPNARIRLARIVSRGAGTRSRACVPWPGRARC